MKRTLSLIGYGEAARTFARAAGWGPAAAGWDLCPEARATLAQDGCLAGASPEEALADAPLVLCLVTADQALAAARDYAPLLRPGAIWADCNSVAPGTKRAAAQAVAAAGGRYVDVAILAPVEPARLAVPLLLAGPGAAAAYELLGAAGFANRTLIGDQVGRASAIKLIRSVMVKGIEALTAEMMLAAEAAGVTDAVLSSLDESEKAQGWRQRVAYNIERMTTHGLRRAAEMEESAATLRELGIEPVMTAGTVIRQRDMAGKDWKRNPA
jgi:3-hydroxyisobutyrate dehydrogenase-like beta-hydroxyacid dehydrogenase